MMMLKINKKIYTACGVIALVLAACSDGTSIEPNTFAYASSSSGFDNGSSASENGSALWNPELGDFRVHTARYAMSWPKNAIADGRWFWEVLTDAADGGESRVLWPVELDEGEDPLRSVMDACHGICGTAILDNGSMGYSPFVTIGFSIAKDSMGNPVPVDVSNWEGLCVTYTSDAAPMLVLDLGDSLAEVLRYGLPQVSLPKATDGVAFSQCFSWSDFKLPPWLRDVPQSWRNDVGEQAAKQLVAVRFRIQAYMGEYKFNLKYIGAKADDPVVFEREDDSKEGSP
jgi:hypothetical protein